MHEYGIVDRSAVKVGPSGNRNCHNFGGRSVHAHLAQDRRVALLGTASTTGSDLRTPAENSRGFSVCVTAREEAAFRSGALHLSRKGWEGGIIGSETRHLPLSLVTALRRPGEFALGLESASLGNKGRKIGIGGAVTCSPLPHHRAYGSVHGGSAGAARDRARGEARRARQRKH